MKQILLFSIVFSPIILLSCNQENPKNSTDAKNFPTQTHTIPYRVVKTWPFSDGSTGYGKVIVIDPKYRNESDLKALGENLRIDTKADLFAAVFIYDNEDAVVFRDNTSSLNEKDSAFYWKHDVGDYSRNGTTGYNQLQYSLSKKGWMEDDSIIVVKYK